jgi:propionate CoA-transferase
MWGLRRPLIGMNIFWGYLRVCPAISNFQALTLRTPKDALDVQEAVERKCKEIGKKVDVIVNYDGFEVGEPALDAYTQVVEHMVRHYYGKITRYTTSAFLRDKLGSAIQDRGLAPHIYETRTEAEMAL